jgi:hypothetical protein
MPMVDEVQHMGRCSMIEDDVDDAVPVEELPSDPKDWHEEARMLSLWLKLQAEKGPVLLPPEDAMHVAELLSMSRPPKNLPENGAR